MRASGAAANTPPLTCRCKTSTGLLSSRTHASPHNRHRPNAGNAAIAAAPSPPTSQPTVAQTNKRTQLAPDALVRPTRAETTGTVSDASPRRFADARPAAAAARKVLVADTVDPISSLRADDAAQGRHHHELPRTRRAHSSSSSRTRRAKDVARVCLLLANNNENLDAAARRRSPARRLEGNGPQAAGRHRPARRDDAGAGGAGQLGPREVLARSRCGC